MSEQRGPLSPLFTFGSKGILMPLPYMPDDPAKQI